MSLFVRRTLVVHLVIMIMALIFHRLLEWELEEPVGRLLIKGMIRPWYGVTSSVTKTISSQRISIVSMDLKITRHPNLLMLILVYR